MNKQNNMERILDNPIIAAVSDQPSIDAAIASPCEVIFILESNIFNMKLTVDMIKSKGKLAFLHFDLMKGISHDHNGLEYIKAMVQPDGIITTKSSIIKKAKELELITIQRVFILDSKSIDMGIKSIRETKPDIIEIMPGVIPKTTERMAKLIDIPIIAGGLIDQKKEIIELLNIGAVAISTSHEELWYV